MEAMDLMDPKRRRRHNVQLMVGYVLVGIALLLLTVILLFVAYGFGLQNGRVIQSGLLFLSSTPNPAQIYVDGARYQSNTNTKLLLPEATYQIELKRDGYRDWQRDISVTGGQVESFTYPFLFPVDLTTKVMQQYTAAPEFVSESIDQHWLVLAPAGTLGSFAVYDLTNPAAAPVSLTLPKGVLTSSSAKQALTAVAWASDNNHLLLEHIYGQNTEYILLNRSSPAQSLNVTGPLNLPRSGVTLQLDNGQQDHYLVYDARSQVVSQISLGSPSLVPLLAHVLTFAADAGNGQNIVYAVPDSTNSHLVDIMMYDGTNKYLIRHDAAGDTYQLAAAEFGGDTYVAIAAAKENAAYVYEDPITQINDPRLGVAVPAQAFDIKDPTYAGFSTGGQFAVFESGARFASYDAENQQGFTYTVNDTLDAPQTRASWMDDARLYYISRGQIIVFDYDGHNRQSLVPADPRYPLVFDSNYKFLYAFARATTGAGEQLTSTALRTPADQ